MHHPTLSQRYCNNTCSHQSSLCYFSDFTAESRWTQMKTWARTSHESLMKTATPMPCRACFCEFDGSCWYWRLRDIIPAVPWLRTKRKGARPRRPMRARRSNIHHCAWLYACRSDWSVNKHDFQRLLRVFRRNESMHLSPCKCHYNLIRRYASGSGFGWNEYLPLWGLMIRASPGSKTGGPHNLEVA